MKIRTAMLYALVILLLAGLTATAWYYWLTQGGSVLLPVFVSLLSLCLAVYGLLKTAWRAELDVQQLQRQQQCRELRHYLKQTGRRLRRSGGAPRRNPAGSALTGCCVRICRRHRPVCASTDLPRGAGAGTVLLSGG